MAEESCVPEWFTRAIEAPVQSRRVQVDGTSIHYLIWNQDERGKPALLFAHGFRAHARWWSFIAPFFLSRFRVLALDFAGMGDSGERSEYAPIGFTHDIVGVLDDARLGEATLVGHSFGGGRVLRTCAEHPERVSRAIVIDSHVRLSSAPRQERPQELRPKRTYPTFDAARARFRLVPPQNRAAPCILDYVARHSLKQVEGGWTWKFDQKLVPSRDDLSAAQVLSGIDLPVTYIYGDASAVVSRQHAHEIVRRLRRGRGPIAIPQCHHHVMLDQPLALVAALKAVLY